MRGGSSGHATCTVQQTLQRATNPDALGLHYSASMHPPCSYHLPCPMPATRLPCPADALCWLSASSSSSPRPHVGARLVVGAAAGAEMQSDLPGAWAAMQTSLPCHWMFVPLRISTPSTWGVKVQDASGKQVSCMCSRAVLPYDAFNRPSVTGQDCKSQPMW